MLIYLAAPYNHVDRDIVQSRIERMYEVMAELMKNGEHVVSPLFMHEVVMRHKLPCTFEYWENYSYNMLKRCDRMLVLRLPGWDVSPGVKAEIDFCGRHNIPVDFID